MRRTDRAAALLGGMMFTCLTLSVPFSAGMDAKDRFLGLIAMAPACVAALARIGQQRKGTADAGKWPVARLSGGTAAVVTGLVAGLIGGPEAAAEGLGYGFGVGVILGFGLSLLVQGLGIVAPADA